MYAAAVTPSPRIALRALLLLVALLAFSSVASAFSRLEQRELPPEPAKAGDLDFPPVSKTKIELGQAVGDSSIGL